MKPGAATLSWLHFGAAATAVVGVVGGVFNVIPGWGTVAALAISGSSNLVAGYIKRKEALLEPPPQPNETTPN